MITVRGILENDIAKHRNKAERLKSEAEFNLLLVELYEKVIYEKWDKHLFSMVDEGCPNVQE